MKKNYVLIFFLGFFLVGYSQTRKIIPRQIKSNIPFQYEENTNVFSKSGVSSNQLQTTLYPRISTAAFVFGFIMDATRNVITYNKDLNVCAIFQRKPYDWNGILPGGNGASGYLVSKWSTDYGLTWDSTCYFQRDTFKARYPSGVIYNPIGNTNIQNARLAAVGPVLFDAVQWRGNYSALGNFSSGIQYSNYRNVVLDTDSTVNMYFLNTAIGQTTDGVFAIGRKEDEYGELANGLILKKGVFHNDSLIWQTDSIVNQWFIDSISNTTALINSRAAFSPNGQVGYILTNGCDSSGGTYLSPMLWKSIDAGNTWFRVNQNYNWISSHPEILDNLIPSVDTIVLPSFNENYGADLIVDANDVLHYVTIVEPGYTTDSTMFSYSEPFKFSVGQPNTHPWIFDYTTNGNGVWNTNYIAQLYTGEDELCNGTVCDSSWLLTSSNNERVTALQVGRSNDGTKIFYTWTDSDSTTFSYYDSTRHSGNYHPNIYYTGYDINSNLYSPIYSANYINSGYGGYWFYNASDVLMEPAAGSYMWPGIFVLPKYSTSTYQNRIDSVNVHFLNDLFLYDSDFNRIGVPQNTSPFPNVLGKSSSLNNLNIVSQNFPNPFSYKTNIEITVKVKETVTLKISTIYSEEVFEKQFELKPGNNLIEISELFLRSGVYTYTVQFRDQSITKKMLIVN